MTTAHLANLLSKRRVAALLAGLASALVLPALAPSSSIAAEKGLVPEYTWGITAPDQLRTAAAVKDLGAQWVRLEADWKYIQPSNGTFDPTALATLDEAVALSRSNGEKIVMLVGTAPQWASGSTNDWTSPQNPQDFAKFVNWLATRYAGEVAGYEIWNEENSSMFWGATPDPAAYARLLQAAAPAVRAADPAAKVVFGGLSMNDWNFVDQAYAAMPNLGSYYDVMATHPYANGQAPEQINYDAQGRITPDSFAGYRQVEATMQAHGDTRPIWFTEMGWASSTASGDWGVGSEAAQADYLTRAYKFLEQDPGVQVAIWYETRNAPEYAWGDPASNDANDWIDQLGLMHTDFTPKAAYYAFKAYGSPATTSTAPPSSAPAPASAPSPAASSVPPPASASAPSAPHATAPAAAAATATAISATTRHTTALCRSTLARLASVKSSGAKGRSALRRLQRRANACGVTGPRTTRANRRRHPGSASRARRASHGPVTKPHTGA